jgi:hypothetical protein
MKISVNIIYFSKEVNSIEGQADYLMIDLSYGIIACRFFAL